jgi:hypothetical protein
MVATQQGCSVLSSRPWPDLCWADCSAAHHHQPSTGDKVIADGLVVESLGLVIDEASLTGESDPIKKNDDDPWVRSGTQVRV